MHRIILKGCCCCCCDIYIIIIILYSSLVNSKQKLECENTNPTKEIEVNEEFLGTVWSKDAKESKDCKRVNQSTQRGALPSDSCSAIANEARRPTRSDIIMLRFTIISLKFHLDKKGCAAKRFARADLVSNPK